MSALRKHLSFFVKKWLEKKSRATLKATSFRNDYARYNASSNKKPARLMRREMKALHKYWGCYPFQYYRFDFYRADCPLSLDDMKKYVPQYFFIHLYFPHSYKEYAVVCEDKLLTHAALKAFNVPQPKLLLCYDHQRFFDGANNPITPDQADALINACTAKKLFLKPRYGAEGKGIVVFNKKEPGFKDEHDIVFDHNFFKTASQKKWGRDGSGCFIVQEGLAQHYDLSRIYPLAVNTYRIITECTNGEARVLYAVVRMGGGGRQIDNSSAGGSFVRLNMETGALYNTAQAFDQSIRTSHPDTGFVFNGAVMETWPETKAFTIATARKFRDIRYLGWDIAVTEHGPSVIEFNNKPDIAGIQDSYGGVRDEWNIDPKDWWHRSHFTLKNL